MESQDSNARPANVEPGLNNVVLPVTGPQLAPAGHAPDPKTNHKKTLPIAVALLLIIAVGGGLFWQTKHKTPKTIALAKISVQLEWVNNPEFAGMYVAKDMGFYRDAGLDVNIKEFQDSTDVTKEVASGKADYGVSTPLELIIGRDQGEKTKAIAAIYQTSAYAIASPKSANIQTPSDFKGKILGNSGDNSLAKVTYAALIASAGLDPAQVAIKTVDLDPVKVFNEKQADTFDLYRTDQIYLLDQAKIPYNQIFPEEYGFDIYGDVLTASDAKIAQKPAQVRAFTQATLKGWQYAIDHQPETLAILAKYDNVLYKDPAYVKYDLTNTAPLIRPTGSLPIGDMQYVPWNRAYEGVKTAGLLKTDFNPTDAYTDQFIK